MNKTNIKHQMRRTFSALAVVGALLALPSANGDSEAALPMMQAKPDSTASPAALGATMWYVPGTSDHADGLWYSFYFVLNLGTQPGLATLSLRRGDGSEVGTTSATVEPMSQVVLASVNADPNEFVVGYVVITSEVPVILHAYQQYGASQADGTVIRYLQQPLNAFAGRRQR